MIPLPFLGSVSWQISNSALLLSRFSRVRLCATPEMAAHQVPPSLGFSRQEHWSGLPFPSPMHESEKWKWSRSVVSDSLRPNALQPTRLLCPWDFPGKSTRVGCHCLLQFCHLVARLPWENCRTSLCLGLLCVNKQRSIIFIIALLEKLNTTNKNA